MRFPLKSATAAGGDDDDTDNESDNLLLDDNYYYYQSLLQDAFAVGAAAPPSPTTTFGNADEGNDDGDVEDRKKRRRSIAKLLTSLAALEAQEESDRRDNEAASRLDLSRLEDNHQRKAEAMVDYYSRVQDHFSVLDDFDALRTKRARLAASTLVAAIAEGAQAGDAAAAPASGGGVHRRRRLWVKDRSRDWWDRCNHPDFPEAEFRRAFRMRRATFDMICEELGSSVAKEDTMLRAAIPVRQRVAVCIWRLATGEPLRLVSKRFGLGISTCHKLVLEVCSAIRTILMPRFLQWPDEAAAVDIKARYEAISGIPNVVGSMYTTHIPIIAPKTISAGAYVNRRHTERNQKTSYSITVQGVVNPDGVFTDVCIGWPGSMADEQVLERSALHQRAAAGMLREVWIVGSSGYPLMDWVMVPYTHQNLTWAQHALNERIGEVQRIAREAFGRLKRRWRCLRKRTEVKLQELPVVLGACCVLHNICELRKEEEEEEEEKEEEELLRSYQLMVDDEMLPENTIRSARASQARDSIAHNLLHHHHA